MGYQRRVHGEPIHYREADQFSHLKNQLSLFAFAHPFQILKMRFSTTALALTAIVSGVTAAPTKRQDSGDIDAVILQYALTLEHLENAFYKKALSEWDEKAFTDAGFSSKFYNDLKYVAHDEEGHVVYLEAGLTAAGAMPVAPCEYSFPMTDPKSFVALSSVIEGVGVSAYL